MHATSLFANRASAGRLLAGHLRQFAGPDTVVLGIPRGGVVVAAEVARELGAGLDVVVARKLPAPDHEEVAIGAVTASGSVTLDAEAIRWLGVPDSHLRAVIDTERAEAARREHVFRTGRKRAPLVDRIVIVVDDGLATGATIRAALQSVRHQMPRHVVAAAPVGSPTGCRAALAEADEIVCPFQLPHFEAVSRYYDDFRQVTDREVQDLLSAPPHVQKAG